MLTVIAHALQSTGAGLLIGLSILGLVFVVVRGHRLDQ